MARLSLGIPAITAFITAIPLCFSACGLGSDMDVGDDQAAQTPTSGGGKGSGGRAATGGATATGGLITATGGVRASGGAPGTGGAVITSTDGGAPGGATATGGKPATGGASGSGGIRIGVPCGKNTCAAGLYCCNPSCGTCAALNEACTQQACDDPPTGVPCGNTVCAAGEECCNPSCSTCVEKGGGCTQQICEPTTPCTGPADCRLEADYCTGCNCRALSPGEKLPACAGPGVQCFADPCGGKAPICKGGKCVVQ
jgi:hypothetical protein